MLRRIIHIDEGKCNGCGACAAACHEGAIRMVGGKARLMRDDYCDGLGDCLPACPTGAITFTEREAAAYDEEAVMENKKRQGAMAGAAAETGADAKVGAEFKVEAGTMADPAPEPAPELAPATAHHACPGSMMRTMNRWQGADGIPSDIPNDIPNDAPQGIFPVRQAVVQSQLAQWPCQIKLVPTNAPYFDGAKLIIAADCTAYAYARMHEEFMRGKITVIGCPKLDGIDYSKKLTEIIAGNDIQSVTIVRMEVPCCGGLEIAARNALQASGKFIPWQVVTISIDGKVLD